MNGYSFIKIYIKHIQNICKGKIILIHASKSVPWVDTEYKIRERIYVDGRARTCA